MELGAEVPVVAVDVAGAVDGRGVDRREEEALHFSSVTGGRRRKELVPGADGVKYIGQYKDGKEHGEGTKTFADGNKYVGQWKESKTHGKGTFTWASGAKYVGEMFENDFHGQGTKTLANGTVQNGRWEHDEFKG